jgi:hypothetical protein
MPTRMRTQTRKRIVGVRGKMGRGPAHARARGCLRCGHRQGQHEQRRAVPRGGLPGTRRIAPGKTEHLQSHRTVAIVLHCGAGCVTCAARFAAMQVVRIALSGPHPLRVHFRVAAVRAPSGAAEVQAACRCYAGAPGVSLTARGAAAICYGKLWGRARLGALPPRGRQALRGQ